MPTACGSWRRAWRRVGKAEVNMGCKGGGGEAGGEGGGGGGGG